MIAYSKKDLRHLHIQQAARAALDSGCITAAEYTALAEQHPVPFYMPPFAIRAGLFILTAIVTSFSLGLFLFSFTDTGGLKGLAVAFFVFTLLSYGMLEVFAGQKHHFCSGVDDALLWATALFFLSALNSVNGLPPVAMAAGLSLLTGYLALRFTDAAAAGACALSLLCTVFLAYSETGDFASRTMPFVMMGGAAALYFGSLWLTQKDREGYYAFPLIVVRLVALIAFYASGNYFMVREAGSDLLGLEWGEGGDMPLAPFFWAFTVAVPLLYLYQGVRKKDALFLRAGLLLTGLMVLTLRYYYHAVPVEWVMVIGGALMTAAAYGLIRYLESPRNGFIYREEGPGQEDRANAEALVVLQGFPAGGPQEAPGTGFGGGSGGGAGASGSF